MGFFDKIKAGLKKTRENISSQIHSMLHAFTKIDEELFEELEELLVMADVGVNTAERICDTLRARVKERGITDPNEIMGLLEEVVTEMIDGDNALHLDTQPSVILVIGVNGVGKTTTIGKIASRLKKAGQAASYPPARRIRSARRRSSSLRSGRTVRASRSSSTPRARTRRPSCSTRFRPRRRGTATS